VRKLFIFILFILFCIFVISDEITEELTVTSIEVPVRVMYKGKSVTDLNKSDFQLFENGKEQMISSFYQIKKMIKNQDINLMTERTKDFKPRYFVLVFRIYKNTVELEKAIDYIFNSTLYKKDKLLLFINNKTLYFDNIRNKNEIKTIIKKDIQSESRNASIRFEKAYQKIRNDLNTARFLSGLEKSNSINGSVKLGPLEAKRFLENYEMILKEYRKRFLTPDINIYYNFAKHLENISLEKWVITFYQFEKFPVIKLSGRLRSELGARLDKIDRQVRMIDSFPSEEIAKLFYKVNTTFHSLFFTTYENINSRDLKFGEISTDLENSFREITKKTGGSLIVSNNLKISMKKLEESVDSYYMLTYSPNTSIRKSRIHVKVKTPGYRVYYDDNMRANYISEYLKKRKSELTNIRLEKLSFNKGNLEFSLNGIMLREIKKKIIGSIRIHLQIKEISGDILYDKSKNIQTENPKVSFKIGFHWLKEGTFDLILEIVDLFTNKTIFNYKKVEIK